VAGIGAAGTDCRDDRIDDQRSDVGDGGGQDAGDQCQAGESESQGAVGAPDQLDGAAAVAEDAEESAESELFYGGGGGGTAEFAWTGD